MHTNPKKFRVLEIIRENLDDLSYDLLFDTGDENAKYFFGKGVKMFIYNALVRAGYCDIYVSFKCKIYDDKGADYGLKCYGKVPQ